MVPVVGRVSVYRKTSSSFLTKAVLHTSHLSWLKGEVRRVIALALQARLIDIGVTLVTQQLTLVSVLRNSCLAHIGALLQGYIDPLERILKHIYTGVHTIGYIPWGIYPRV